jgi:hypothetical protein
VQSDPVSNRIQSAETFRFRLNDTRTILMPVTIGSHHLSIAANYFDYPLDEGGIEKQISLVALWPGLEPKTEENTVEFSKVPGWGRRVRMLVTDLAQTTSVALRYEIPSESHGPFVRAERRFGLTQYKQDVNIEKTGRSRREHYVIDSEEAVQTFLSCRIEGSVPEPGCSHLFDSDGLLYELNYSKDLLPNWLEIQNSAENLIKSFSIGSGISLLNSQFIRGCNPTCLIRVNKQNSITSY